jgi:heat shock protein HspQ
MPLANGNTYLAEMQVLRDKMGNRQGSPDAQEAFECLDTAVALYVHAPPFYHVVEAGKIIRKRDRQA